MTRLGFEVSETTEKRSDEAKKFQATSPQNAYTGYGAPTSIVATRVKITVKDRGIDEGHEDRPPETHHGLLVTQQQIAHGHAQQQFAVFPLLREDFPNS